MESTGSHFESQVFPFNYRLIAVGFALATLIIVPALLRNNLSIFWFLTAPLLLIVLFSGLMMEVTLDEDGVHLRRPYSPRRTTIYWDDIIAFHSVGVSARTDVVVIEARHGRKYRINPLQTRDAKRLVAIMVRRHPIERIEGKRRCHACGYDLRMLSGDRNACPECGRDVPLADLKSLRRYQAKMKALPQR